MKIFPGNGGSTRIFGCHDIVFVVGEYECLVRKKMRGE